MGVGPITAELVSFDDGSVFLGVGFLGKVLRSLSARGVSESEAGEFSESGAALGGGEQQGLKTGMDRIGQLLDLGGGEEPLLGMFDLGQLDALAG